MYFEPEMKVVLVESVDVIRTSQGNKETDENTLPEDEL